MQYLVENTDKVFDDELNKFVVCENYYSAIGFASPEMKSPLSKDALSFAKLLKFEKADSVTGVVPYLRCLCVMQNVELYASSSDITYEDRLINLFDYMLQNLNCIRINDSRLIFALGSEYIFSIKNKEKLSIFLTKYRIKHKIRPRNEFKEVLETL